MRLIARRWLRFARNRVKQLTYGIGGFSADVVQLRIVLEEDGAPDDEPNFVKVDHDFSVVKYAQVHFAYVHFAYCLS